MTLRHRHLHPRGIAGQLALLLVASLLLFHALAFLWLAGVDRDGPPGPPDALLQRQVAAAWLLDRTAPAARPTVLEDLAASDPDLALAPAVAADAGIDWSPERLPMPVRSGLAKGIAIGVLPPATGGGTPGGLAFRLADGSVLVGRAEPGGRPFFFFGPATVTLVFLAVSLAVLGVWAARSLTAPLRRFSGAVDRFGRDGVEPVALEEQGPDELRRAAAAFNRMQERINRLVEDRTRMLAAVGHDLRTPITRLRLRSEYVEDGELRESLLGDLDHMDALLKGAIAYLSEGRSGETATLVDLPSLLATIGDRWTDAGTPVAVSGPRTVRVSGRPTELLRLFGNLVDNAMTHGGGAEIVLAADGAAARVDVVDHGPGIAGDRKAEMLAPFTRGDAARGASAETGFGLGLAICTAIAKGHGGTLTLLDTPGGGLTARVELPLAA